MPSLKTIISGDASPLEKELRRAYGIAEKSGTGMKAAMAGIALQLEQQIISAKRAGTAWDHYSASLKRVNADMARLNSQQAGGGLSPMARATGGVPFQHGGVIGQSAALRKMGGIGGARAQLLHVGRATLDSLASGMNPGQVFMQQAPQVGQALASMRLGWVALGVAIKVAIALIAAKMISDLSKSHFLTDKIAEGFRKIASATQLLAIKQQTRLNDLQREADLLLRISKIRDEQRAAGEKMADTNADEEKEKIRAAFILKGIRTKETELELEKQLLRVDLERAKAKRDQIEADVKSGVLNATELAEKEAALARFNASALEQQTAAEKKVTDAKKAYFGKAGFLSGETDPKVFAEDQKNLLDAKMQEEETRVRLIAERKQLEKEAADARAKSPEQALKAAQVAVTAINNQLSMLGMDKDDPIHKQSGSARAAQVNELQRIGGMAVGESPLVDIGRAQLRALQTLVSQGRGGSINQGFGG